MSAPDLPGLPRDAGGPVFAEPWQARAFALAVQLHARGAFEWPAFAAAWRRDRRRPAGRILRGVASGARGGAGGAGTAAPDEVEALTAAWQRAAAATPHGQPIRLA